MIYFFCGGFTTSLSWNSYEKAKEVYQWVLENCGEDKKSTSINIIDEFKSIITISNKNVRGLKLQYQPPEDIALAELRNIQIEYTKELIKELKNKHIGDSWKDSYGKPDEEEGD